MVEGLEREERVTRARERRSSAVRSVWRERDWEGLMVMFGGEVEAVVSMRLERWVFARVDFSRARERRASVLLGAERRVWERAIVRHL